MERMLEHFKTTKRKAYNRVEIDFDKISEDYKNNRPVSEIAKEFGTTNSTIYKRLSLLGITRTNSASHIGQKPWNKGNGYIDKRSGYRIVSIPSDHRFACMGITQTSCRTLQIREHRLVMAQHLGRPLERWEVVHHKNHVRDDNRIENLELIQSQTHHQAETITHYELVKMKDTISDLSRKNKQLEDSLAALKALAPT